MPLRKTNKKFTDGTVGFQEFAFFFPTIPDSLGPRNESQKNDNRKGTVVLGEMLACPSGALFVRPSGPLCLRYLSFENANRKGTVDPKSCAKIRTARFRLQTRFFLSCKAVTPSGSSEQKNVMRTGKKSAVPSGTRNFFFQNRRRRLKAFHEKYLI